MIKELEKSKITQYKVHYEHIFKMKNKIQFLLFLVITIIVLTRISSFQKEKKLKNKDKLENIETIKKLYYTYNDGEFFNVNLKVSEYIMQRRMHMMQVQKFTTKMENKLVFVVMLGLK